jgi:hypothetical protein
VPLKSTGHRNTGTRLEEVEDPMVTARAQDEQQRVTARAQEKQWRKKRSHFLI